MSGIILQGKAIKITNSGGGCKTKTIRVGPGIRETQTWPRDKGTDYVTFNCPACGKRNKRSMFDVKGKAGESLSFVCNGCRMEIEVSPPSTSNIILDQYSAAKTKSGLVGVDGRPL